MKRVVQLTALSLAGFMLIACAGTSKHATFASRGDDYLKAKSVPPLVIPKGLTSNKFKNMYPVASHKGPYVTKKISTVPPGLYDSAQS